MIDLIFTIIAWGGALAVLVAIGLAFANMDGWRD